MIFTPTYDYYLFLSSSAHMHNARGSLAVAPTASAPEISFIQMFKSLEHLNKSCKTLKGMDFSRFKGQREISE
jgi:hypothetical protein